MKINIVPILRKDRTSKAGSVPIHIRVTHNRKSRFVGTGIAIPSDSWDIEKQRVKPNTPDSQELQLQIDKKISKLNRRIRKLEALEIEVTLDNLLETNGRKVNCTLGECLDSTITRLESLGKYGSASKHRSLRSRLSLYRSLNIRMNEIDLTFLRDFELYLRKIGNTNNSIATKFAIFKAAYNKALSEGLFIQKSNPFSKYKVGSLWAKTRKRAITKEDVQRLADLEMIGACYRPLENYLENPQLDLRHNLEKSCPVRLPKEVSIEYFLKPLKLQIHYDKYLREKQNQPKSRESYPM